MPTDGERLATLEQRVGDLARTIGEHIEKAERRSDRVRELEAALRAMMATMREARDGEKRQYQRIEIRIQWLTLVVGLAAVISPILAVVLHK